MSNNRANRLQGLAKGTRVDFTVKNAVITSFRPGSGGIVAKTGAGGHEQYWLIDSTDNVDVTVKVPAHRAVKPGQVWEAAGLKWFARKSRPELKPRFVPEDMTDEAVARGIQTLDEDKFFMTYPDAKLVFPARQTGHPHNGAKRAAAQNKPYNMVATNGENSFSRAPVEYYYGAGELRPGTK